MKFTELSFSSPEIQKLSRTLSTVLVNVSKDNMKFVEITGTSNGIADTSSTFRHAIGRVPSFWFPLEGRIYVPRHGADENEIDIRSTVASEPFRMLIVA